MNSHNQQNAPAWDFMQFLDPSSRAPGQGVDHQAPIGGPWGHHPPTGFGHPWGPGQGWGGPRHRPGAGHPHHWGAGRPRRQDGAPERAAARDDDETRESTAGANDEKVDGSDRTVNNSEPTVPDPAEVTPGEDEADTDPASRSPCGPGRRGGRRGCGRSRRGCGPRAGHFHNPDAFSGPSPNWPAFHGMMHGIVNPLIRDIHDQARRYTAGAFNFNDNDTSFGNNHHHRDGNDPADDATAFTPPLDVYNTKTSYVVHVALPGARKEDLGVAWDPDTARLRIAGVVHRPGDELLLAALASGERRVGLFERHVALPPAGAADEDGERDAVDADNISAKMDNGILVVIVPKLEKEWTQIRRVDIE
ncbi:hsp20/alpha crystallin family protein [Hirsutella rhossiliensis]|uniref:Hsp20/alpha crystallin family domain-containing protein n=1 Tax=Hirsutella rhossiliensis TaxID=111463 RepID=A0A9P8MTQ4_9HYPO|nr:hsp20/alpha crystallin family domain-containing protein [Hirsutella rhossiliensis]KAH0960907.1 hsp20/alpha crystallin family domain-containing protein [Hirsutella rhossiliensis]